jgi:predicted patatin/cPLA2 family phospholipase
MILEGDSSVIQAIQEKKRLMDAGQPSDHIKPVLMIDGGLMKGTYGVGAGQALEELGYTDVFDSIVGVSSGAPSAAYFVSGAITRAASLIWEECCDRRFLNMWRFWNQVNTDYFIKALQTTKGKQLDAEKVLSARTKLYIGVADFTTGEPLLYKPTTPAELFTAIQASILMPNVSSDIVHINDIRYVDGGFTKPHVLELVFNQIEATHFLIITNQDHIGDVVPHLPFLERFLNHTLFRWRMPKALRFAAHERWKERMKAIQRMQEKDEIPIALIWGDRSITSMERDPEIAKAVIEKSRLWWKNLLPTNTPRRKPGDVGSSTATCGSC